MKTRASPTPNPCQLADALFCNWTQTGDGLYRRVLGEEKEEEQGDDSAYRRVLGEEEEEEEEEGDESAFRISGAGGLGDGVLGGEGGTAGGGSRRRGMGGGHLLVWKADAKKLYDNVLQKFNDVQVRS